MYETRKLEISSDELERRLYLIRREYGINATLLFNLLNNSQCRESMMQNLSKHAKRKLQRRLQGSSAVLTKVEKIIANHRNELEKISNEYQDFICSRLTCEQMRAYNSGKWTPEILDIVSIAQKTYYHNRVPSPSEAQPKVRFEPSGQYRTKWNR
ncbi:MAG TPA: hypothetical protein VJK03_04430 [Candidatus Nanoarchaeia archaeon]|nr:hypothetical protein [Candidatus Nanoarchaeia archaeon]